MKHFARYFKNKGQKPIFSMKENTYRIDSMVVSNYYYDGECGGNGKLAYYYLIFSNHFVVY